MPPLVETIMEVILLLLPISSLEALLGGFGFVVDGVGIHGMHVVNTVCPLRPQATYHEIPLLLTLFRKQFPLALDFVFGLPPLHGATCENCGVVVHVCGGEVLTCKSGDPITEIIVKRRDEADLIAVKGMVNIE